MLAETQLFFVHNIKKIKKTSITITRYDYNPTIMESPKLATDNRFKKSIKSYL
jgi:hypothetical protein